MGNGEREGVDGQNVDVHTKILHLGGKAGKKFEDLCQGWLGGCFIN